jgi:bisphosphoglycerate-independent phosphoglycerate mutase (AlkP superfamily)
MVHGTGTNTSYDLTGAMQQSYNENVTDEFIKPLINSKLLKTTH